MNRTFQYTTKGQETKNEISR